MATATEYASAAAGTSWTTPTNANADDAAYATYTIAAKNTTGNINSLSSFGFDTSIPAGSTINSVTLEVEHKVSTNGGVAFLESAVAISGTPGTFNSDSLEPTVDTARVYASMARPGGGSWTRADLLDAVFTVRLRARSGNNATSVVYSWDYARVVVDYTLPAQNLAPGLFTSDTNAFYAATVSPGAVDLAPGLFSNSAAFYSATVTPGPVDLAPGLVTNGQTFYAATVDQPQILSPTLVTNTSVFYAATVTPGAVNVTPALFSNAQSFYAPTVSPGAVTLEPGLYSNAQTFYAATVSQSGPQDLAPSLLSNVQAFYTATVAQSGGEEPAPSPAESPLNSGGGGNGTKSTQADTGRLARLAISRQTNEQNKVIIMTIMQAIASGAIE